MASRRKTRVHIKLKLRNPTQVYRALTTDHGVIKWLEFIAYRYVPTPKKVLLLYPCSAVKPYFISRSYRMLFSTLAKLERKREHVHLVTISEPYGLVPEEYYGAKTRWHDWQNEWYDCPGLFRWWCTKNRQPYNNEHLEASVEILSKYVALFFKRVSDKKYYDHVVGFVRTYSSRLVEKSDHTHKRIIEKAAQLAGIKVYLLPTKSQVRTIVEQHGKFVWDMYGVAHPAAQTKLLRFLEKLL